MHFPLGARGNNFYSQIKIIYTYYLYSWSKRIPFASSGPFCGWSCAFLRTGRRYEDYNNYTHIFIALQDLTFLSLIVLSKARKTIKRILKDDKN